MLIRLKAHLERLLAKANQDKKLLRNMKNHYWARMHVCKAKMKVLQRRLAKALKRRKRPDPLRILAEASLKEHGAKWLNPSTNFKNIWAFLVICEFFGQKTCFLHQEVAHHARPFRLGGPFQEKFAFLDLSCKNTLAQWRSRNFTKFWASRRSKNKQKMTFCHLFDTQEAVLGDFNFGGENGHQIQKFHLGWKLDIQTFPTSPLLPH